MPPTYSSSPGLTTRCVLSLLAQKKEPECRAAATPAPQPKHSESHGKELWPGQRGSSGKEPHSQQKGVGDAPGTFPALDSRRGAPARDGQQHQTPPSGRLSRHARARSRPPPPARQEGPSRFLLHAHATARPGSPRGQQRGAVKWPGPARLPTPTRSHGSRARRQVTHRPAGEEGGLGEAQPPCGPAPEHRKERPARPSPVRPGPGLAAPRAPRRAMAGRAGVP